MDALEEERDEEKAEADEAFRADLTQMTDHATTLCNDLVVLKMVSRLLLDLENDMDNLEECKAADPEKDYSACYRTADKAVEQIRQNLKDSSINVDHQVYQQIKLLAKRLLTLKTQAKVELKPSTTIIRSDYDRNFDIPKVNIPKFKGGLEAWYAFWSRYKAAVEDNDKLREPVKMAILIDLIADPSLHDYLIAANDGSEGRYRQAISYLQDRFDRPRELHQIYCKQLVDLPPVKANPTELSQLADTIFAAVAGLRRSGQATIDCIATSLATPALPSTLRLEWENKTEEEHGVPNVDQLIAFIRKKATNAAQAQKPSSSPAPSRSPREKKPQKPYPKAEGKVYYTQGEFVGGGGDQAPSQNRQKPSRSSSSNSKTKCTLCSNPHYLFQCPQFQDMTVSQRLSHIQSVSVCSNCLRGVTRLKTVPVATGVGYARKCTTPCYIQRLLQPMLQSTISCRLMIKKQTINPSNIK